MGVPWFLGPWQVASTILLLETVFQRTSLCLYLVPFCKDMRVEYIPEGGTAPSRVYTLQISGDSHKLPFTMVVATYTIPEHQCLGHSSVLLLKIFRRPVLEMEKLVCSFCLHSHWSTCVRGVTFHVELIFLFTSGSLMKLVLSKADSGSSIQHFFWFLNAFEELIWAKPTTCAGEQDLRCSQIQHLTQPRSQLAADVYTCWRDFLSCSVPCNKLPWKCIPTVCLSSWPWPFAGPWKRQIPM